MTDNINKYVSNLRYILEEKGYEIVDIVFDDPNLIVTTKRFGLIMTMKFSPEKMGLI